MPQCQVTQGLKPCSKILDSWRLFITCHFLTAQYTSEFLEIVRGTELLNIVHYIYGERVINNLSICCID